MDNNTVLNIIQYTGELIGDIKRIERIQRGAISSAGVQDFIDRTNNFIQNMTRTRMDDAISVTVEEIEMALENFVRAVNLDNGGYKTREVESLEIVHRLGYIKGYVFAWAQSNHPQQRMDEEEDGEEYSD